jgi:hypothetical protein
MSDTPDIFGHFIVVGYKQDEEENLFPAVRLVGEFMPNDAHPVLMGHILASMTRGLAEYRRESLGLSKGELEQIESLITETYMEDMGRGPHKGERIEKVIE